MRMMCKRVFTWCLVVLLIVTSYSGIAGVSAAAPALSVEGTLVNVSMKPGDSYVHTMTVSSGSALEMTVEACGFGQSEDGSYIPLRPEEDTSPYTARPFISNIDRPNFTLTPGSPVTVKATIKVPAGTTPGTRFALINIYSKPTGSSRVGVVLSSAIPVICTVGQFTPSKTGKITELHASGSKSGQMIVVRTKFRNTGNTLFKVRNRVTVTDSSGREVASYLSPETKVSIIPTYYRVLEAPISLDVTRELPAGKYRIESRVILSNPGNSDDGMLLDSMRSEYAVGERHVQQPKLDVSSVVTAGLSAVEEARIDAREVVGVVVNLKQLNPRESGRVVVFRYTEEPPGIVPFSAPVSDGGMGKSALRFLDVWAEGYSQGTAVVAVSFDESEVKGWKVESLFLAYFDGRRWNKCGNPEVQPGAGVVSGEIPVVQLTGTIFAVGGDRIGAVVPEQTPKAVTVSSGGSMQSTPTPAVRTTGSTSAQDTNVRHDVPPVASIGGVVTGLPGVSGEVASLPSSDGQQVSPLQQDALDVGTVTAVAIIGFGLVLVVVLMVMIVRRRADYR